MSFFEVGGNVVLKDFFYVGDFGGSSRFVVWDVEGFIIFVIFVFGVFVDYFFGVFVGMGWMVVVVFKFYVRVICRGRDRCGFLYGFGRKFWR